MSILFKTLLLTILLLNGQAALATPQADAEYIAQRNFDSATLKNMRRELKASFVSVYFRPLSKLGIEIIDEERFIDLIPDEDVAPFVDRLLSRTVERYLSIYTPQNLASLATLLRANEDEPMKEILSEVFQKKTDAALEQARAEAPVSGSDDQLMTELENLTLALNTFIKTFEGDDGKAIGQHIAAFIAPSIVLVGYGPEIAKLHRELDNPVTIAALKADGVLKFANPVQQQTLLRQLSDSEDTGGIQFSKPPAINAESN